MFLRCHTKLLSTRWCLQPFSETPEAATVLDFAVRTLVELDAAIPEDVELATVEVTVNAQRLADIVDLLLVYAECYEGADFDDQFAWHEAEAAMPVKHRSTTVH